MNLDASKKSFSQGLADRACSSPGCSSTYTALAENKHVTWIPSYGPEMRGGTAELHRRRQRRAIGSPVTLHTSIARRLHNPSHENYESLVKPGGLLDDERVAHHLAHHANRSDNRPHPGYGAGYRFSAKRG